MPKIIRMKAKVCLAGEQAVGKTSLIRRFVLDQFDDAYQATLGAKVSKKEVSVELPDRDMSVNIDMTLWDIMGSKGFRELLKEAYFHGAQGVLAVSDITRKNTLDDLREWHDIVHKTAGEIPWVLAVNKFDLKDRFAYGEEEVRVQTALFKAPYLFTSAKTGERVEEAFSILGRNIIEMEGV
ncbi:MAG: Rab family GTPase [Thermoplasmata archaeon]